MSDRRLIFNSIMPHHRNDYIRIGQIDRRWARGIATVGQTVSHLVLISPTCIPLARRGFNESDLSSFTLVTLARSHSVALGARGSHMATLGLTCFTWPHLRGGKGERTIANGEWARSWTFKASIVTQPPNHFPVGLSLPTADALGGQLVAPPDQCAMDVPL